MQLCLARFQAILVAYVNCNPLVASQIINVLIDENQGGIGGPAGDYLWLGHSIFNWQVEIEGRILGIG